MKAGDLVKYIPTHLEKPWAHCLPPDIGIIIEVKGLWLCVLWEDQIIESYTQDSLEVISESR